MASAELLKKKALLDKIAKEVEELEKRDKLKLDENSEKILTLKQLITDMADEHLMQTIEIIKLLELQFKTTRKRTPTYPKYFNPEDRTITWTGRGRRPAWIKELVERGEDLDRYRIQG